MRRFMIGLALLAAFAAPSYAQRKPYSALSDDEKVARSVQDEIDRQYKATINQTRQENDIKVDPWSNMRGADAGKTKR